MDDKEKEKKKKKKKKGGSLRGKKGLVWDEAPPPMESTESSTPPPPIPGVDKKKKRQHRLSRSFGNNELGFTLPSRGGDAWRRKSASFEFWQQLDRAASATQQEPTTVHTPPTAVKLNDNGLPSRKRAKSTASVQPLFEGKNTSASPLKSSGKSKKDLATDIAIMKKPKLLGVNPTEKKKTGRSNSHDGAVWPPVPPKKEASSKNPRAHRKIASSEENSRRRSKEGKGIVVSGSPVALRKEMFEASKKRTHSSDTESPSTSLSPRRQRCLTTGSLSYGRRSGAALLALDFLENDEPGNSYGVEVVREYFEKKLKIEVDARKYAELQFLAEKKLNEKLAGEKLTLEGELKDARNELAKLRGELESLKGTATASSTTHTTVVEARVEGSELKRVKHRKKKSDTTTEEKNSDTNTATDGDVTDKETKKPERKTTKKKKKHSKKAKKENDESATTASVTKTASDSDSSSSESEFSDSSFLDSESDFSSMSDFGESDGESSSKGEKKLKRRRTGLFRKKSKEDDTEPSVSSKRKDSGSGKEVSSKERIERRREKRMLWKMKRKTEERKKSKKKEKKDVSDYLKSSGEVHRNSGKEKKEKKDKEKKEKKKKGSKEEKEQETPRRSTMSMTLTRSTRNALAPQLGGMTDWEIESPKPLPLPLTTEQPKEGTPSPTSEPVEETLPSNSDDAKTSDSTISLETLTPATSEEQTLKPEEGKAESDTENTNKNETTTTTASPSADSEPQVESVAATAKLESGSLNTSPASPPPTVPPPSPPEDSSDEGTASSPLADRKSEEEGSPRTSKGSAKLRRIATFDLRELKSGADGDLKDKDTEESPEKKAKSAGDLRHGSNAKDKVVPPLQLARSIDTSSPRKKSATSKIHKAFGDRLGALLTARPTKEQLVQQRLLSSAVFGVPLENLLDTTHPIPVFVDEALTFLEGTYKESKDLFLTENVDKDQVAELKELLNEGRKVELGDWGPNVVAETLRRFLDQLPEAVVPEEICNAFLDATEIEFYPSLRINAFHSLLYSLPSHCRELIRRLIELLVLIWKDASDKKKVLTRLCESLGPVLFRIKESYPPPSTIRLKMRVTATQVLVTESDRLFGEMDLRYQMKDGKQLVSAGKVDQLVEKLLDTYYKETEFVDMMFLTHSYFTTSVELLQKLIALFEKHNHLPSVASRDWQHRVRMRILELLKTWVTDYFYDLASEGNFPSVLLSFTEPRPGISKASIIEEEEHVFNFLSGFITFMEEKQRQQEKPVTARSVSFYHDSSKIQKRHRKQESMPEKAREKQEKERLAKPGGEKQPPSPRGVKQEVEKKEEKKQETHKRKDSTGKSEKEPVEESSSSSEDEKEAKGKKKKKKEKEVKEKDNEEKEKGKEELERETDKEKPKEKNKEEGGNEKEKEEKGEISSSTTIPTSPEIKIEEITMDLADASAEHVASQLTLIDQELYRAVKKRELIKKRFLTPALSPAFNAMVDRFNLTGQWVVVEILKRESASQRGSMIAMFIRICEHCKKIRNFNSVFAILAGLNATPVSRLKQSWEKVPRKEMGKYKKLMQLVDVEGNYNTYRFTLQNSKPPLVPYLALFSKDLFNIEEANSTMLGNDMVSVNKLRMIWKLVVQFSSYQIQYPIAMDTNLRAYLKSIVSIPEIKSYEISYRHEPPKNATSTYL